MKRVLKITTIIMAFAIVFTSLPAVGGSLEVHAASVKAPAQVKGVKASATSQTAVKVSWTKIKKNKNTKGYAVYRGGRLIKRVGKGSSTFNDKGLAAATKYSYVVKAYNTYKQKQYYNSKTKKWVNKKPKAAQWKGKKTRKVTKYKYGKASASVSATTKGKIYSRELKLSAKPNGSNIVLSWTSNKNISGMTFKVYRNGSIIATVRNASYTEKGSNLQTGQYDWYVVTETATEICESNTVTANYKKNSSTGTTNSGTTNSGATNSGTNSGSSSASSGGNSGSTGSASTTSQVEYITVVDYKGVQRKFAKGDVNINNPRYNRNIDGEWDEYPNLNYIHFVQKRGVTIMIPSIQGNIY